MLSGVLLSAELKDRHLHTGLVGVCGVLHGDTGAGLNEVCPMLETWWMDSWSLFLMEWVSK